MDERHEHEQCFFDEGTLEHLMAFVANWPSPACLCAPLLGKRLADGGSAVTVLDIDERFAAVPGFIHFDLERPQWLGVEFGLIVCDPPFFNVSLTRLFEALRLLSRHQFEQPLLISYLSRRAKPLLQAFAPFQLQPTGYFPGYAQVEPIPRNEIEFFSNLSSAQLAGLAGRDYTVTPD